jgi:hypothetical protein
MTVSVNSGTLGALLEIFAASLLMPDDYNASISITEAVDSTAK